MTIRPYRYYLIDLDRTLWDFDSFFMRYDVLNHRLWAMYEKGEMTKEDLRWKRFHEAFRRYGIEDEALARQFGEDYLEQMVCENRLMPGAREMLEAIRSAGGKMAILSNGFREVQYRKLRGAGIAEYFSAVVVSEEAGCLKPRPGIFAYAVERLSGIRRQDNLEAWREAKRQTLMIGEHPPAGQPGGMARGQAADPHDRGRSRKRHRRRPDIRHRPVLLQPQGAQGHLPRHLRICRSHSFPIAVRP